MRFLNPSDEGLVDYVHSSDPMQPLDRKNKYSNQGPSSGKYGESSNIRALKPHRQNFTDNLRNSSPPALNDKIKPKITCEESQ